MAMAVIRSSILRVDRTVIWMISSEIFSGICSMAEVATAVFGGRDSSRAMAAVLAAAVSRARGRIFMQRSGVSFEDAAFGCEKVINLSSGQGTPAQSLKVRVPAGIEDGKVSVFVAKVVRV